MVTGLEGPIYKGRYRGIRFVRGTNGHWYFEDFLPGPALRWHSWSRFFTQKEVEICNGRDLDSLAKQLKVIRKVIDRAHDDNPVFRGDIRPTQEQAMKETPSAVMQAMENMRLDLAELDFLLAQETDTIEEVKANPALAPGVIRNLCWYLRRCKRLIEQNGEVVLTRTLEGELVAVTRQGEEGKILKVLWEKEKPKNEENGKCEYCGSYGRRSTYSGIEYCCQNAFYAYQ